MWLCVCTVQCKANCTGVSCKSIVTMATLCIIIAWVMLASFSMGDKLSTTVVHHIVQATVVLHSGLHQGLHFVLLSDFALLGEYRVLPQVSVDGLSYLLQHFPFPTGATTTLLPSRASSFDMARPIPVLSPVTTDTLPENSDGCRKRENPLWSRDFHQNGDSM